MILNRKRGQIWIETVVYTLIGLSLIGLVLGIVTPKINEFKDRSVIEQTIDSLNVFDTKINEILTAPGNIRILEFKLKRGDIFFDNVNDEIRFVLDDSRSLFSEPDIEIEIGEIKVKTKEGTKRHTITLTLKYNNLDLTFEGDNLGESKFSRAGIPYKFKIENKGFVDTDIPPDGIKDSQHIDISES